jgi:hypothetical protein
MEKQQQPFISQHDTSENMEDEELSDTESFSSNEGRNSQELPKAMPPQTPRSKTTLADHKAIDIICDSLREKITTQYRPQTSQIFSKPVEGKRNPER